MDNPFSWEYLTTVPGPNEVWGTLSIIYVILFVTLLVVSIGISANWLRPVFKDVVLFRMARRWANWGMGIAIIGLFFFLVRWLQINPFTFGERIWMWLSFLAFLALIGYTIYDYHAHYDVLKSEFDARTVKERYLKEQTKRTKHGPHSIPAPPPRPVRRRR